MPWPLQEAINHGLAVLSWYENYSPEEIPSNNLWDDSEAIEKHFEAIRIRRDEKYSGNTVGGMDDEEMVGNDFADSFKD